MSPPKLRSRDTPLSYNGALVVQAMAQGHKYGFEIMRVTALKSGTVYPLLRRLEAAGLVQSNWENKAEAFDDGRPARRYYEPTAEGERVLGEALKRLAAQRQLFGEMPA